MGKFLRVDGTAREYRTIDIVPYLGLYLNEKRNRKTDETLTDDQKLEKGVFRLYHMVGMVGGAIIVRGIASWVNAIYQMVK